MPVINAQGERLVERFEGLKLEAYDDGTGTITIGYGHTGPDVVLGMHCTQAQATIWLSSDLTIAEKAVADLVEIDLTPNQFSALVSFVFNVGSDAFANSTMLALINAGDLPGAAEQFERWDYAGGQIMQGLVYRRQAERELFETPG